VSAEQTKSPEVLALEEQLTNLQFKFNNLVEHAKVQDRRIEEQGARLNQVTLYDDGVVWHWMGDGSDLPETLTCPVIVPAPVLRELMAKGHVMRELVSMAAPMSPAVLDKAAPLQVVGRIHHNDQHPEPVRAALNTAGLELPDDTKLYADAGSGSIITILSERDFALVKVDQLAGMVIAAEELLRDAYNAGKLGARLMSKLEEYFARRAAGVSTEGKR
jgi:hypothetical protein